MSTFSEHVETIEKRLQQENSCLLTEQEISSIETFLGTSYYVPCYELYDLANVMARAMRLLIEHGKRVKV